MNPDLDTVLEQLRGAGLHHIQDPLPVTFRTVVVPAVPEALPADAPPELRHLWQKASLVEVHRDMTYGQWGCVLHGPAWAADARQVWQGLYCGEDQLRLGEWLVGEFLGDSDRLFVQPDGGVVIARPIEHRPAWPRVAGSLAEFLARFFERPEEKYWEHRAQAA